MSRATHPQRRATGQWSSATETTFAFTDNSGAGPNCSERVVRKAEKGEPVRRETVAALATALGTADHPLSPEDLASDPLSVAQAFMRAYFQYRERTGEMCRHLFHPQMQMVIHTTSDALEFGGVYVGLEGIDEMIQTAYAQVVPAEAEFGRWYVVGG